MNFNSWNWFWNVCFGVTAVTIIICNFLSIFVLLKRTLRKRSHYLLIDLAIADLLVGLFTIPIYMMAVISGGKLVPRLVLDCVDMFTGLCSIFTLTVIALERLHAIARPLRHRQLSSHSYLIAMVTPWILSLTVASTRVLLYFSVMKNQQFVIVITVSLATPLLITCTAYCGIWRKQASRLQNEVRGRSDARLSKTLFLITGTFVLTWLPFQVLNIVSNMCVSCRNIPIVVVFVIKLLQFGNSFVNFFIYCLRMQDYRKAISELLFFSCTNRRSRHREINSLAESRTSIELTYFSSTLSLHNASNPS